MSIGSNLKELRRQNFITMDMMSYRSNISKEELRSFESDKKSPSEIEIRKMAIALGVAPEEITK